MILQRKAPHAGSRTDRGTASRAAAVLLFAAAIAPAAARAQAQPASGALGVKWAASWATAIQSAFVLPTAPQNAYVPAYDPQPDLSFALPDGTANGVTDQTLRMIVTPDLWGPVVRIRLSNVFGTKPVTFAAATIALRERSADLVPGTAIRVTFNGGRALTVPPGQSAFSDPVTLPFVNAATIPLLRGRDLAVSFAVSGSSGPASWHQIGVHTSYIAPPDTGDRTAATDATAFPYSTTGVFFLSELDVLAPADTAVVAAFGDSITDGTDSTVNGSDRWPDVMAHALHARFGDKVSVVNEGIAGNGVAYAITGQSAIDRAPRDLLGLSGLSDVIWLEGINDLGALHSQPGPIVAGYRQVVATLDAAGVKAIGATITSSYPPNGVVPANSPLPAATDAANYASPQVDQYRRQINDVILTGGLFDGTADFAAATIDPATGSLRAPFVPNSEGSAGDDLHPNRAGYQVLGTTAAAAVSRLLSASR